MAAQFLAQRVARNERLELAHKFRVSCARQVCCDALGQSAEPHLLETRAFATGEGLAFELGQGRASPERERVAQKGGAQIRVAGRELLPSVGHESLEPFEIELPLLGLDRVARLASHQRFLR